MAKRPKTPGSGRKAGTPNKITGEVRERMRQILRNEEGWLHLEEDFRNGKIAAPVFLRLLEYVVGKPKDRVDLNVSGEMEHTAKLSDDLLRRIRQELVE